MATATAAAITASGIKPAAGFRITGGTASDRLTIADIVAAVSDLELDTDSGTVTQAGTTAQTFILGDENKAILELDTGNTTTVLQIQGASGLSDYAVGDDVVINGETREIQAITTDATGGTITLTSALSNSPHHEDQLFAAKTTFVHLENCTFELISLTGLDHPSLARGNSTSKVILSDQCDLVVGTDLSGDPALNTGVTVRGENLGYDYYAYSPILSATWAKIVCHGLIRVAGTGNSRIQLVNRHPDSIIRFMAISFAADPWISGQTATGQSLSANVDLDVETAEIYAFANRLVARDALTPDGLKASSLSIPTWVVAAGNTPVFYSQTLDALPNRELILEDIAGRAVGSSGVTGIRLQYVDDASTGTFRLRRWGGPLTAASFSLGNDDGHFRVVVEQEVTLKFQSPAGAALDVKALIETASYDIAWPGGEDGTPTVTDTDYGEDDSLTAGSEISVNVEVAVIAGGRRGEQGLRGADSGTAITFVSNVKLRYSAWLYGREILVEQAVTLESEVTGRREVIVQMTEDELVTAATAADVADAAEDFDDVYDMLHKYVVDNEVAEPYTVDEGVMDVGSRNVTFAASTATLAVSDTAITIPCIGSAVVEVGHSLFGVKTSGTITIDSGVAVHGELIDSTGKLVTIYGLPAGHDAVVGAWPKSQGTSDRSNIVTAEIPSATATRVQFTLDVEAEYYIVSDAVSYLRHAPVSFDTEVHRDLNVSLHKITDAAGNDLVPPAADLTVAEVAELALIDYDAENDIIEFGATTANNEFSFNAVARGVEVGQSSTDALRHEHICMISTGAFTFESGTHRTLHRKSGVDAALVPDLSAFQFNQIGVDDIKDFVDYSDGAIIVNDGVPSVVSLNVSDVNVTQTKWDERMAAVPSATRALYKAALMTQTVFSSRMAGVPSATRDLYKGSGSGSGASVDDIVDGIKGADFPTVSGEDDRIGSLLHALPADLVTAIKGADFPTVSGEDDRIGSLLHGIGAAVVAAVKGADFPTVSGEDDRLGSLLHGIGAAVVTAVKGADFPTVSGEDDRLGSLLHGIGAAVVTAVKGADFPTVSGEDDRIGSLLQAVKTAVDALPTGTPLTTTQLVDAIKGADFPTVSGEDDRLGSLLHGIGAAVVTAVKGADFPTVSGQADRLGSLLHGAYTGTPPTAAAVAAEVRQLSIEAGVDLQAALRLVLAVVAGTTTIDTDADGNERVTFKRLDSAATAAVRVSVGDDEGERTAAEVV